MNTKRAFAQILVLRAGLGLDPVDGKGLIVLFVNPCLLLSKLYCG